MSTILKADQIIVLRDGEIIQQGTHETCCKMAGSMKKSTNCSWKNKSASRREAIIAGVIKIPLEERRSTQQFAPDRPAHRQILELRNSQKQVKSNDETSKCRFPTPSAGPFPEASGKGSFLSNLVFFQAELALLWWGKWHS